MGSQRKAVGPGRRERARIAARAGFSLLEMIVAISLMGLAVVGLLSLTRTSLSNAAQVREYDRASMLVKTLMNDLLVADQVPLNYPLKGNWPGDWGWDAVLQPYELPPIVAPGSPMLVHVKAAVWWGPEKQRRRIELDAYRRMNIRPSDVDLLRGAL